MLPTTLLSCSVLGAALSIFFYTYVYNSYSWAEPRDFSGFYRSDFIRTSSNWSTPGFNTAYRIRFPFRSESKNVKIPRKSCLAAQLLHQEDDRIRNTALSMAGSRQTGPVRKNRVEKIKIKIGCTLGGRDEARVFVIQ